MEAGSNRASRPPRVSARRYECPRSARLSIHRSMPRRVRSAGPSAPAAFSRWLAARGAESPRATFTLRETTAALSVVWIPSGCSERPAAPSSEGMATG
jgi:hypothetical protein